MNGAPKHTPPLPDGTQDFVVQVNGLFGGLPVSKLRAATDLDHETVPEIFTYCLLGGVLLHVRVDGEIRGPIRGR